MALAHGGGIFFVRDRSEARHREFESDRNYAAYTLEGYRPDASITVRLETEAERKYRDSEIAAAYPVFGSGTQSVIQTAARTAEESKISSGDSGMDDDGAIESTYQQIRLYDRIVDIETINITPLEPALLLPVGEALTDVAGAAVTVGKSVVPIPAAYTYFGQFLAHDMTWMKLDPAVDLTGTAADGPAWINGRNGHALEFDTLFGTLPEGSPRTSIWKEVSGASLGQTSGDYDNEPSPMDLPRVGVGLSCAADLRTDSNLGLAQMHVLLGRFHQALTDQLGGSDIAAQRRTRRHLQAVVLTDYLPRLIPQCVVNDVMQNGRKIVATDDSSPDFSFEVPIEFAAACMRFGHSMVNDPYRNWIIQFPPGSVLQNKFATVENLFHYTLAGAGLEDGKLEAHWVQYWRHMVEHNNPDLPKIVTAKTINAATVPAFQVLRSSQFPPDGTVAEVETFNLAQRTLVRGATLRLPSGQQMHDWIFTALGKPGTKPLDIADFLEARTNRFGNLAINKAFCEATPLWFYTLAEAEHAATGKLGPVAGRVVMETFHASLQYAKDSIITVSGNGETNCNFTREVRVDAGPLDGFDLKDVVAVAYGGVD